MKRYLKPSYINSDGLYAPEGWKRIDIPRHDYGRAKPHEAFYSAEHQQIVVCGQPPAEETGDEPDAHNCDMMGCGWGHVIARLPAVYSIARAALGEG